MAEIESFGGEAIAKVGHVDRDEDVRTAVGGALARWGRLTGTVIVIDGGASCA